MIMMQAIEANPSVFLSSLSPRRPSRETQAYTTTSCTHTYLGSPLPPTEPPKYVSVHILHHPVPLLFPPSSPPQLLTSPTTPSPQPPHPHAHHSHGSQIPHPHQQRDQHTREHHRRGEYPEDENTSGHRKALVGALRREGRGGEEAAERVDEEGIKGAAVGVGVGVGQGRDG